jgi:squalene-hopene/tetraprenyl-beta-curcumene cyclase
VSATGFEATSVLKSGVRYLINTQKNDGTWDEAYFTGTGFPNHFYIKYHLYQQYFSLLALGKYEKLLDI